MGFNDVFFSENVIIVFGITLLTIVVCALVKLIVKCCIERENRNSPDLEEVTVGPTRAVNWEETSIGGAEYFIPRGQDRDDDEAEEESNRLLPPVADGCCLGPLPQVGTLRLISTETTPDTDEGITTTNSERSRTSVSSDEAYSSDTFTSQHELRATRGVKYHLATHEEHPSDPILNHVWNTSDILTSDYELLPKTSGNHASTKSIFSPEVKTHGNYATPTSSISGGALCKIAATEVSTADDDPINNGLRDVSIAAITGQAIA